MHRHQPMDILASGAAVLVNEHPISSSIPLPSTMSTSGSMRRRDVGSLDGHPKAKDTARLNSMANRRPDGNTCSCATISSLLGAAEASA